MVSWLAMIYVRNPKESMAVQDILFKVGFHWGSNEKSHRHITENFLTVDSGMGITYCGDFKWAVANFKSGNVGVALNASNVINDPMCVPGAKSPEKMITIGGREYSESTIKAALREYAK